MTKFLTLAFLILLAHDCTSSVTAPEVEPEAWAESPIVQTVVRSIRTAKRVYKAYTAPPVPLIDDEVNAEVEELVAELAE